MAEFTGGTVTETGGYRIHTLNALLSVRAELDKLIEG